MSVVPRLLKDHRKWRVTFMILGMLFSAAVATATADVTFEQHEVVTGGTERQTVLPGFFLGGAMADLAVVHVDESGDRILRLYAFDGDAWALEVDAKLRSDVQFVDVATGTRHDLLITFAEGRLSWFDPASAAERQLMEVTTSYKDTHDVEGSPTKPPGDVPHVDITRDLNHDGLDDLVLPDFDGFWISVQESDGSFSSATRLGPPEPFVDAPVGHLDGAPAHGQGSYRDLGITAATIPIYLTRVHEMDYDQDGRSDLVFWNEDHFDVHLQDERGSFDSEPRTFTTDAPFDSDGTYSRMFEFVDKSPMSLIFGLGRKTEGTVLHSILDVDGDQVADLVTLTLSGRSVLRMRSVYKVHFGTATADGTVFTRDAGTVIHPRGRAGGMQPWGYSSQQLQDFDGDGQTEIFFRDVRTSPGGMMRAMVGNSVALDLELYRLEEGDHGGDPATERKIRRFAPFAGLGNVFFPPVLMGDVDGDGRADLVVGHSPEELQIFFGEPGTDLLARKPQKVAVTMPPDERHTRLVDLNRDGKQDLVILLGPSGYEPDRPNRLATLIVQ